MPGNFANTFLKVFISIHSVFCGDESSEAVSKPIIRRPEGPKVSRPDRKVGVRGKVKLSTEGAAQFECQTGDKFIIR
jgi:hypothetical protein